MVKPESLRLSPKPYNEPTIVEMLAFKKPTPAIMKAKER